MSNEYTERYQAYCKAHGRAPANMKTYDRKRWKGGCTAGFQLWVNRSWRTYGDITGDDINDITSNMQNKFDQWLKDFPQPPL